MCSFNTAQLYADCLRGITFSTRAADTNLYLSIMLIANFKLQLQADFANFSQDLMLNVFFADEWVICGCDQTCRIQAKEYLNLQLCANF